jgi:hypothetical protein
MADTTGDGDIWTVWPDGPEDAREFGAQGFRPVDPERFPWRCTAELEQDALIGTGHYGTRCVLVEGHEGEHRGEVTWS